MGIELSDLPDAYQRQALEKYRELENRKRTAQGCGPHMETGEAREKARSGKYRNLKDGRMAEDGKILKFDSRKEARRFDELNAMLRDGKIRNLKLQAQYTLQEAYTTPEGQRVRAIRYQADFAYERSTEPDVNGQIYWIGVVEDVKSRPTRTREYVMKKKLMREKFGIEIQEV